jgi:hypothetical protein
MNKSKQNLPIYALSLSLVFLGVSISANGATAASTPAVSAAEIAKLKNQISQLRSCASMNFINIRSYNPETNWTALNRVTSC